MAISALDATNLWLHEQWKRSAVGDGPIEKMDLFEVPYEVNSHEDNVREIVRIVANDHPSVNAFLMDMTFLASQYGCIYGQCCSNRPQTGVSKSAGCCTESVSVTDNNRWSDEGDIERIERLLPELDKTIFANRSYAKKHGVFREYDENSRTAAMRTRHGACIFSNPYPENEGDPGPGCAFHLLAMRHGVSHVETKPEVCWEVPLWNEIIEREDGSFDVLITGMSRGDWGGTDDYEKFLRALSDYQAGERDSKTIKRIKSRDYIGWWCIDTPDAYQSGNPAVYVSEENELRKIMTDQYYERFRALADNYTRNTKMVGERVNAGRPTIATVESLFSRVREAK